MTKKNPSEFRENISNEAIEIELLLKAIYEKYGYDFRNYSKAHLKRRIRSFVEINNFNNVSELQHAILFDHEVFHLFLLKLSVNVTEMFRDPEFYLAIRKNVIPKLKTYPYIKLWHAGCSTGEEVYSMAILLKEEGLFNRTQIYATDFNQIVLEKAKEGIYPIEYIKKYTSNYNEAGGKSSFSDYYTSSDEWVMLDKSLKKKIVFADHNLVTDGVFGEMNIIICRNVLIYFDRQLQNKVLKLFYQSLVSSGFLCLGSKESLLFTECATSFQEFAPKERIYKKLIIEK